MKNLIPEEENIIRNIRNRFRLEMEYEILKIFLDFYKPVRVNNFRSSNYIEYESNNDRNKTLSVEEYLNKISPYLKDIINNLKKSETNVFNTL